MKALTARKIIAIFTAVSLAFLQAVPAGVAANTPVDQIDGTSVLTSEKPATDTTAKPVSAQATASPTTTDFQMDTGGIVRGDASASEAVPAVVEQPVANEGSPEDLTNDQLQSRIDQLLVFLKNRRWRKCNKLRF